MKKTRLVNILKSPCHECPSAHKSKNENECAVCTRPRKYDDAISFGIQRFYMPKDVKNIPSNKVQVLSEFDRIMVADLLSFNLTQEEVSKRLSIGLSHVKIIAQEMEIA